MSGSKYQVAWESEEAPELNFGVLTVVLLKPNLLWFSEREILRKYNFQPASNICNNMTPRFLAFAPTVASNFKGTLDELSMA